MDAVVQASSCCSFAHIFDKNARTLMVQGALGRQTHHHPTHAFAHWLRHDIACVAQEPWETVLQWDDPARIWALVQCMRARWHNGPIVAHLHAWLHSLGMNTHARAGHVVLRANPPSPSASAQAAYGVHRDTWYGYPLHTLNLWMALNEVPDACTFALYPTQFAEHVANSSAQFDPCAWLRGETCVHPTAPHALLGDTRVVVAGTMDVLHVFCAHHLHHTLAHDHPHTRWSVDVRVLFADDAGHALTQHDASCPRLEIAQAFPNIVW